MIRTSSSGVCRSKILLKKKVKDYLSYVPVKECSRLQYPTQLLATHYDREHVSSIMQSAGIYYQQIIALNESVRD